ncbi:MAG: hypothetical protein ACKOSO_05650, partial [Actinomycetota bacterium]
LNGTGFSITNPNTVAGCGCGSSFQLKEGEEAGELQELPEGDPAGAHRDVAHAASRASSWCSRRPRRR